MLYATAAGNLGKDAELRQAGGSSVLNFSIATISGYGDRKQTNWVNCAVWGKRAEALAQYLKKGDKVTAVGELSTRLHDGKTYLEMNVSEVILQGGQQQQQAPTHQPQNTQPAAAHPMDVDADEDIPF